MTMISNAADLAQIVTAAIAFLGAMIAAVSVLNQRSIARRRAAIDFHRLRWMRPDRALQ